MKDKIFLLSIEDVTNPQYGFSVTARKMDFARKRTNTGFLAKNPEMSTEGVPDFWWLRSPGRDSGNAMYVYYDGDVNQYGIYVVFSDYAVCPALRLNLKSSHWAYAGVVCTDGTDREVPFEKKMQSVTLKNPDRNKTKSVTYDSVWFGHYPQTDATGANVEPIKWRVLEVKDGVALLHADQNLDAQPFNKTWDYVTWDTCSLRSWLNGFGPHENICNMDYRKDNFLDRAFTPEEQKSILV